MVWQCNIDHIVNLSKYDGPDKQDEKYWPEILDKPQKYGEIKVRLRSTKTHPGYKERELLVIGLSPKTRKECSTLVRFFFN